MVNFVVAGSYHIHGTQVEPRIAPHANTLSHRHFVEQSKICYCWTIIFLSIRILMNNQLSWIVMITDNQYFE